MLHPVRSRFQHFFASTRTKPAINTRRTLSTRTEPQLLYKDEVDEGGNDEFTKRNKSNINDISSSTTKTAGLRPRLEALRERLRHDDADRGEIIEKVRRRRTEGCGTERKNRGGEGGGSSRNLQSIQNLLVRLKDLQTPTEPEEYDGTQDAWHRLDHEGRIRSAMLRDKFDRVHTYLRISLTERCNLRCQYCMPPEGVPLQPGGALLTNNEILRLVRMFVAAGVDKIRLTGGEPLLRPDLADLISQINSIKNSKRNGSAPSQFVSPEDQSALKSVGITTNGLTLSRHIADLVDAGMTHVNISLDTLREDKFVEITRRKGLQRVLRAIDDAASALPDGRVKVNCVVMRNFNDDELMDFVAITKDRPVDVRFIEWMPFNDNGWCADRFFPYKSMLESIQASLAEELKRNSSAVQCNELLRMDDGAHDTTKWYGVRGHKGRVGFITSMSEHFCGTCNRLRITADGQLKVCLFGSEELNMRDAMRSGVVDDDDLALLIGAAVRRKKFSLGGHGNMHGIKEANDNRPMTLIGG